MSIVKRVNIRNWTNTDSLTTLQYLLIPQFGSSSISNHKSSIQNSIENEPIIVKGSPTPILFLVSGVPVS